MPAPAETVRTGDPFFLVGQREDLEDVLYRVAPEETPFTSNIGKATAKARLHEWQLEQLATPIATNQQLEGDDYANAPGNNPTRVGNYLSILAKAFGISRSADIVDKAGRETETARHKTIRGLELKRDMEMRWIGNFASNNEGGGNPRRTAGALAWITTNDSRGAGGADGGFAAGVVAAATNGTQRTFTEALVKTVMANLFAARGGMATRGYQAYMGGPHKQQFSAFTGVTQLQTQINSGLAKIIGAADMYQSDFGILNLIPHPYGLTRDCLIIDPEMWAVATLDGIKTKQLGATGDSEKWLITCEKTLVARNERASTVIADLL